MLAEAWVACNSWGLFFLKPLRWEVQGVEGLNPGESYLVIANHQSWIDILFLQKVLYRQVPFLRFFLKKELAYVPFLGLAWWALDYPFMNRYSNEYLQKHPEKRGQDLEITRQACERFRGQPIAILNFLEGTRWTPDKWQKARSPFKNLLPPKRGGVAFVLQAMGDQFAALLDVSIYYPQGALTVWDLLCGRLDRVVIRLRKIPIPRHLVGAQNLERKENRSELKSWVQEIWEDKDRWIEIQKQNFSTEGR